MFASVLEYPEMSAVAFADRLRDSTSLVVTIGECHNSTLPFFVTLPAWREELLMSSRPGLIRYLLLSFQLDKTLAC